MKNLQDNANKKKCLPVQYNFKYFTKFKLLELKNILNKSTLDITQNCMNIIYSNYFEHLFHMISKLYNMILLTDLDTFHFDDELADKIKKDNKFKRQTTITVFIPILLGFIEHKINKDKIIPFKLSNIKLKLVETYDLTDHNIDIDFTYEKLNIYSSIDKKKFLKLGFVNLIKNILKHGKKFSVNKILSKIKNILFKKKKEEKEQHIINKIKSYLKFNFDNCNYIKNELVKLGLYYCFKSNYN